MPKGNQINLGASAGIDTDEVRNWIADGEILYVYFKTGDPKSYSGDAKDAFLVWAESLRPVAEMGKRELCERCGFRNVNDECKRPGLSFYPVCFEDEEA